MAGVEPAYTLFACPSQRFFLGLEHLRLFLSVLVEAGLPFFSSLANAHSFFYLVKQCAEAIANKDIQNFQLLNALPSKQILKHHPKTKPKTKSFIILL
jgi:hypothetical protein